MGISSHLVLALFPLSQLPLGAAVIPVDTVSAGTPMIAPARICIYGEVDRRLRDYLAHETDPIFYNIKRGPATLVSQIEQAFVAMLSANHAAVYDKGGTPIVLSYPNQQLAEAACLEKENSSVVLVRADLSSDGRPYRITVVVSQNGLTLEGSASRDALSDLSRENFNFTKQDQNPNAIPLRLGRGWSVETEARRAIDEVLPKIWWRER